MSCRTTSAGSVATTTMSRLHGLEDGQATSLFHELRRAWSSSSAETQEMLSVSPEAYTTWLHNLRTQVTTSNLYTPAMRERAITRIDRAILDPVPAEEIRFATLHSLSSARIATARIDEFCDTYAETLEVTGTALKDEFYRLYRQYPLIRGTEEANRYARTVDSAPQDPASKFAFGVILECQSRCADCGQFTPVATGHSCPPAGNRPMLTGTRPQPDPVFEAVRAFLADLESVTPAEPQLQVPIETDWVGVVEPVTMERFQELYDAARAEIADGNRNIAHFVTPLPGEVTGGLGARGTGNSFGIELELDFPDDDYPYESREIFAQMLYQEGIVTTPFVQRWHYVGDDRPGGEYEDNPNGWICEFDRSVDDQDGERGVEIKSQILYDEPQTWHNIERICYVARSLGARATVRTGLHVNVGGSDFPTEDPSAHNALLRLAGAYDDTIVRLAHNPASSSRHRGRGYCQYAHVPSDGFRDVATARAYSNHYQAFNLGHLPAAGQRHRDSSRIEVRIWDSTVDAGRIQQAVASSMALVHLALRGQKPGQGMEPAGSHRDQFGTTRLSGEDWEKSTLAFRRFLTLMGNAGLSSETHQRGLMKMFAESRW